MPKTSFLSPEEIVVLHNRILGLTKGEAGVRSYDLLASAAARPQATFSGQDLYPDIFHKAAALMHSIIFNHPFVDGNKRTAISAAGIFLNLNGFQTNFPTKNTFNFVLNVTTKHLAIEDIAKWFQAHSTQDPAQFSK